MKRIVILGIMVCMGMLAASAQVADKRGVANVTRFVPYAAVIGMKAFGVESRDDWKVLLAKTAASAIITGGVTYTMKETIHEWRPDMTDRKSFPSGHTAFAFAGATTLHHEFGHISPWVSIGGYAVATVTAVDRVCRDRHHWYDTVAGAAGGFLSAEAGFWITDKLFPRSAVNVSVNPSGFYLCYGF